MKHLEELIKKTNDRTVFGALGIEITKLDADETIVSMPVDYRHLQHAGLVHGGIYVLLAESAASLAAVCTLKNPNQSIVGLEINANHVRSARGDKLTARSKNIHMGKRTLVYEIRVQDSDGQLISISRCTLMVLD